MERPESVADHSFRTAILGYCLAHLEGADPMRTTLMCLFHDIPEARLTDLHHLAQRYTDWSATQQQATAALCDRLPPQIAGEVRQLMKDCHDAISLEARVARDADRLELLLQALEYRAAGYADLDSWIEHQQTILQTNAARQIAAECLKPEARRWWVDLLDKPRSSAESKNNIG